MAAAGSEQSSSAPAPPEGLGARPEDVTSFGLLPVGFVDDDSSLEPLELPLLGRLDGLTDIVVEHQIEVVVLAIPSLPRERFRVLALDAARGGALIRYLPSFLAALEREIVGSDLRALDVRALIGRNEVRLVSPQAQALIKGRRVLVTGAGGSIGSELCRQLSVFDAEQAVHARPRRVEPAPPAARAVR